MNSRILDAFGRIASGVSYPIRDSADGRQIARMTAVSSFDISVFAKARNSDNFAAVVRAPGLASYTPPHFFSDPKRRLHPSLFLATRDELLCLEEDENPAMGLDRSSQLLVSFDDGATILDLSNDRNPLESKCARGVDQAPIEAQVARLIQASKIFLPIKPGRQAVLFPCGNYNVVVISEPVKKAFRVRVYMGEIGKFKNCLDITDANPSGEHRLNDENLRKIIFNEKGQIRGATLRIPGGSQEIIIGGPYYDPSPNPYSKFDFRHSVFLTDIGLTRIGIQP